MAPKKIYDHSHAKNVYVKKTWSKTRVLLTSSVVVVCIFVVIIIAGLIREYRAGSSHMLEPTESQILAAKAAVSSALQERNDDISNYQLTTDTRLRRLDKKRDSQNVLRVFLSNNSTRHVYLIDVNTGRILLHSEIDSFGFNNSENEGCMEINPCYGLRGDSDH